MEKEKEGRWLENQDYSLWGLMRCGFGVHSWNGLAGVKINHHIFSLLRRMFYKSDQCGRLEFHSPVCPRPGSWTRLYPLPLQTRLVLPNGHIPGMIQSVFEIRNSIISFSFHSTNFP